MFQEAGFFLPTQGIENVVNRWCFCVTNAEHRIRGGEQICTRRSGGAGVVISANRQQSSPWR
jgi:hypothetical protein